MAPARRALRRASADRASPARALGGQAAANRASSSTTRRIRRSNTLPAGTERCRIGRGSARSPIMAADMGEVVKLQKPPGKGRKTAAKSSRRRGRQSRTALVLGGGGFTGAVYEIGALR